MSKSLLDYVKARRGKRFRLRCVARCTVEVALAKRLPESVVHTDILVLKDPLRHRVLWVGKTWRMPASLYTMLSQTKPLGRFIRDNMPESLGWRFFCYDAGDATYEFRHFIVHAIKPALNGYGELPDCYKTGGYLVALMERELRKRRKRHFRVYW